MKRLQFLLISILIGVLVGCDADPGKEFDWCYTYEFTTDDFDATIATGTWESGKGFVTTGGVGGSLSFEVFHAQTVEPSRISMDLYLNRSEITPVSIPFSAFFNVFGIESTVSDNVPAIIGIQNITVDSSFGGQIGTSARIIVTTDAEVEVARLTVSGLGFNPFPSSDCERVTPTPTNIMLPTATASTTPTVTTTSIPSATATTTTTPTATASPTNTPTGSPTATPSVDWCYTFDFSVNDGGWAVTSGFVGSYSSGAWRTAYSAPNNNNQLTLYYDLASPADIKTISVTYSVDITTGWAFREIDMRNIRPPLADDIVYNYLSTSSTSTITDTFTSPSPWGSVDRLEFALHRTGGSGGTYHGRVFSIYLEGVGINPFPSNSCAWSTVTPTPLASATPTITPTPSNTPDVTNTPGPTNTPEPATGTPEPATGTPEPTATATGTAIPTRTPFPTPMILPTSTPDPEDDGNEFGSSGTCTNYGGTEPGAESNGEWTEWLFGGVTNLVECVIMPPINWIGDLVNSGLQMLGNLYDFAVYGVQSFIQSVNWFGGQFIPWALGSLSNFFAILWWGLGALISGIFGLLQLIWDTVVGFVNALVNFITTAWAFLVAGITNAQQLVDMWNNAPVVKPPGLPDCVASPTDYDICAFYYVSQNTLLAGIGVIIIPLLTIIVNLLIVGTFIDRIKIFISGLQEVLKQ